jgi:hypothetical protein
MGVGRVLPSLRQETVVPVDVVGVESELALLYILLDGGPDLILKGKTDEQWITDYLSSSVSWI